jgi:alkylated DNA repair protein alkB family protein 1
MWNRLGNSAIFLIGGLSRDTEPVAILLRSGDVIIMSGPACRRAYHGLYSVQFVLFLAHQTIYAPGVPRILEDTLPRHLEGGVESDGADWSYYGEYLHATRININVRQVFPKGFNPELRREGPP